MVYPAFQLEHHPSKDHSLRDSFRAEVGLILQGVAYFMVLNESKTLQDLSDNSPESLRGK